MDHATRARQPVANGQGPRCGRASLAFVLPAALLAIAAPAPAVAQASAWGLAVESARMALQASAGAAAQAQPPGAGGPRFAIARYAFEGARLVPAAVLEAAVARHTGEERTFADIEAAVEAVRAAYEQAGYASVLVTVPEQALAAGVVRLKIEEVPVGRVEVAGSPARSPENVRRAVPGLVEGRVPSDIVLSAQLRLANENPGRQMQVTMRTEPNGQLTAVLRVADRPPIAGQLSLDNTGTASTGRARVALAVQHLNLLDRDIVGTVQLQTSPEPRFLDEVRIAALATRIPVYGLGVLVDLSALYSSVDSGSVKTAAGDYQLASSGRNLSARITRLLPRVGTVEPRVWVGLESKLVQSSVTAAPGGPSLVPDIELRPLQLGVAASWRTQARSVSGQLAVSRNLPGGGPSAAATFAAPGLRAGANPHYTVVRASASWSQAWAGGVVSAGWSGQWTRDALVSAEQFGLGGEGSVRGLENRAASADTGYRLGLEWQSPSRPWLEGSALEIAWVAFADAGQLRRPQVQPGEPVDTTLAGAGFGVRLARPQSWAVRVDVGAVVRAEGVTPTRTGFVHAGADYPL